MENKYQGKEEIKDMDKALNKVGDKELIKEANEIGDRELIKEANEIGDNELIKYQCQGEQKRTCSTCCLGTMSQGDSKNNERSRETTGRRRRKDTLRRTRST